MTAIDEGQGELVAGSGGASAPAIYVIDLAEHPFDVAAAAQGRVANVVKVPVRAWGENLTPWPAPGLHQGDPDFGGGAPGTLRELVETTAPALESRFGLAPARRAVCGYSLGGLFVLYAFTRLPYFSSCACLSGSLWYEGWLDYFRSLAFDGSGRYAFFSIGKRECKAGPRIMRSVQDDMEACAQVCRERGCAVDVTVGPGNHMQHYVERFDAGLAALDAFLLE